MRKWLKIKIGGRWKTWSGVLAYGSAPDPASAAAIALLWRRLPPAFKSYFHILDIFDLTQNLGGRWKT